MTITFERSALYEEVWSEPLTTLAKKYTLSDNGLRKICKAMNIPLPAVGHWARIAAGQQIPRTPLPAEANITTYTSDPPSQMNSPFRTTDDSVWLSQQDSLEERADYTIEVQEQPAHWHQVAAALRAQIDKRLVEIKRWRELDAHKAKQSARQRTPDLEFDSWRWKSFLREGKLVMHVPLRVSQDTYGRALRIVNAVCHAAEIRGFAVSLNADGSRIELKGHGADVSMRMAERLDDKICREAAYAGGPLQNMEVKAPTGSLKLFVGSSRRSEREVAVDDPRGKVESKLNKVFLRINRLIVSSREQQREQEAWKREWKAREAREAVRVRRKEQARKRRETLYREIQQWQEAERIRAYVTHVASRDSESADDAALTRLKLWQSWALSLADKLDPAAVRLARLRSDRNRAARGLGLDQSGNS